MKSNSIFTVMNIVKRSADSSPRSRSDRGLKMSGPRIAAELMHGRRFFNPNASGFFEAVMAEGQCTPAAKRVLTQVLS